MKQYITFKVFFLFILFSFSCNKEQPDGKWKDRIKLSVKTINFDSAASTATVTTQSKGWWLNHIGFNGEKVDISNIENTAQDFVVQKPEFTVERKDGTKIIISMSHNDSGSERVLTIGLQAGDYFDGIKATQAK